jgi:hypothetical protein
MAISLFLFTYWRRPGSCIYIIPFWASTMLRPQSCRDCGRQIGVSTGLRPARLSHITFNNSFRDTSRAASRFARCDVCRQSSRLENSPKPKVPRERRYCRDCGNPFTAPATYIRCDGCRSPRSTVAQQSMIITQSATASFNPFVKGALSFQGHSVRSASLQSLPLHFVSFQGMVII